MLSKDVFFIATMSTFKSRMCQTLYVTQKSDHGQIGFQGVMTLREMERMKILRDFTVIRWQPSNYNKGSWNRARNTLWRKLKNMKSKNDDDLMEFANANPL